MKYLFLDTETNGLPANYRAPFTDTDNWPLPVSIAWAVFDDSGNLIGEEYKILDQGIRDDAFNEDAFKVHGISVGDMNMGIPADYAYRMFLRDLSCATTLIGHNLPGFDLNIIKADLYRNGLVEKFEEIDPKLFCTMQATTNICKLPSPRGRGYKWPKLEELYRYCFDRDFQGAHNALSDVKATAACFFHMLEKGEIEL